MVTPFSGDVLRPSQEPAIDDNSSSDARSHDDPEHHACAAARTRNGLCQGEAVRVILDHHPPSEPLLKIARQVLFVQAHGIAVLHPPGPTGHRPRCPDPHRSRVPGVDEQLLR